MLILDNGAVAKSIHGDLKRQPGSVNYEVYGKKGMMETERFDEAKLNVYIEGDKLCHGDFKNYTPSKFVSSDLAGEIGIQSHGGSDFYATHFFIKKILGNPEGKEYSIDVYTAVDMGICGILAYRSILNGNIPISVPNFRNKEEREPYRYDNACTNPKIASGDDLLPFSSRGEFNIPANAYERVRDLWQSGKNAE